MSIERFNRISVDCPWHKLDTTKKVGYCKATGYICCKNNCAVYYITTIDRHRLRDR